MRDFLITYQYTRGTQITIVTGFVSSDALTQEEITEWMENKLEQKNADSICILFLKELEK